MHKPAERRRSLRWAASRDVPRSVPTRNPSDPTPRKGLNPYRAHRRKRGTCTRVCFVTITDSGKSVRLPEDSQLATHFNVLNTGMRWFRDSGLLTDAISNARGEKDFWTQVLIPQTRHRKTNSPMKSKACGLGEQNLSITENQG